MVDTSNKLPPSDTGRHGTEASPEDSAGQTTTLNGSTHGGNVPRAEHSNASTGSNSNSHMRGSTPPIRPIEIRRFPFLSPAIGAEGATNRARSGLTPASLPNILNMSATASASVSSSEPYQQHSRQSHAELSLGESASGSSPNTSKPSKFSSLHHMVADVRDEDTEYEEDYDDESHAEDDAAGAAAAGRVRGGRHSASAVGHEEQHEYSMQRKRKRRKIDPEGSLIDDGLDQGRLFRKDPVSAGYITEHQARELFAIFMTELNSALPLLDPVIHTFDFVRNTSPFLLSTTLCVASRFLRGGPDTTPELVTSIPPEKARAVHESCLRLARQQMQLTFQYAMSTLEIVQAITLLSIWKEPDDDKAGFYFNRAVVMAKELHLGRIERSRPRTEEEAHWRRIKHRVWLGLFIINTIFAMQFNQILQITHEDPLIANSFDWHIGSNLPLVDLSLIASVQLRARFLHYKSLLEITAADADDLERTDQSHTATLLSLSILTRTSNQDLGNINAHWVEQIREGKVGLEMNTRQQLMCPYLPPQTELDAANGNEATQGDSGKDIDSRDPNKQVAPHVHQPNYSALPTNYDNSLLANGFQFAQGSGAPSNIPLADTIWGGTDDGLWMQFDGAWWDRKFFHARPPVVSQRFVNDLFLASDVMQDLTAKNAGKPMSSNYNPPQPT
ncbi:hypothetical protein QFC19_007648 [Naganishia cerealis]|uniref:Uncharacterized protein n=1 Tax=Naganishia cerealis TaxID=610337 RepID=A0ACC2V807_9TREE|nr:hypothetical protein QFC19_007648 [Naganishia cerealis]